MLCILLVVAYPYDRLLELPGAPERNYNHFQWQAANLQENKSETLNKRTLCSIYLFIYFLETQTFNFVFLVQKKRGKKNKSVITAHSKNPCHLSPWHKSERKDLYNWWHGCCKLVSPYLLSSHRAHKHPRPAEAQRVVGRALRHSCMPVTSYNEDNVRHSLPFSFHEELLNNCQVMW